VWEKMSYSPFDGQTEIEEKVTQILEKVGPIFFEGGG